jgi:nucleotide-binding universal stress UspA family protein
VVELAALHRAALILLRAAPAQRFGAALTILHAVSDPLDIARAPIAPPPREQLRDELVHEAERALHAGAHAVDLIGMGTRCRSGLDRLFLGSTAERVVRHAPGPVISIRAAA